MLHTVSPHRAEGASPPSPRCTTAKSAVTLQILAVTDTIPAYFQAGAGFCRFGFNVRPIFILQRLRFLPAVFEVDFGPFFARFGTHDLHVYTGLVAPDDPF
jgi:hypothetical protein